MAIDNLSKRQSSTSMTKPYFLAPPIPDGEISQEDRQHLAGVFSGELSDDSNLTSVRNNTLRSIRPVPYQFHVFE